MVVLILHLDAPTGLLDYAQETGRASKDGIRAEKWPECRDSTVIFSPRIACG
jgi:superfamily II DNA helicase RecQ